MRVDPVGSWTGDLWVHKSAVFPAGNAAHYTEVCSEGAQRRCFRPIFMVRSLQGLL